MTLGMQKSLPSFPSHCLGRGKSLGGSSGIRPSDSSVIGLAAEGDHPFAQPPEGKAAAGSKWLTQETEGALVRMGQVTSPVCFLRCGSRSLEVPAWKSAFSPALWSHGPAPARGAVHHSCPTWLYTTASLSPLHLQLCTLAQAACTEMTQETAVLEVSPLPSLGAKPCSQGCFTFSPQPCMFPNPTQVICLFRSFLIRRVSGATSSVLCRSAFAGMWMGILQHTGITHTIAKDSSFQPFPPEHFSPCFQDLSSPKNPQAFFFHGSIFF